MHLLRFRRSRNSHTGPGIPGDVAEWARGVIFNSHEEQAQLCHRHSISDSGTGLSNNYVPEASGSVKAQPLRLAPSRHFLPTEFSKRSPNLPLGFS